MRETQTNQDSRPLVLVPAQHSIPSYPMPMYPYSTTQKYPRHNHFIAYFLSCAFIGLLVRFLQVTWHILSFIISGMNSKTVSKKNEVVQPQPHVCTIKEEKAMEPDGLERERETILKDHFLIMASHELKTPMTTIVGQAQLALRHLSRLPELPAELVSMRSALESIDGQMRRLNTLVDDVLDLYNIRSGKTTLRLIPCSLVEVCHEVVDEQHRLTGRVIELEAPIDVVQMYADTDRLYQVVVNLVSNALRYSSEDSSVKVLVYRQRDIGIIEVQDQGVGIPKEQQTHIFEPFCRGPEEQTSLKSGLGLGLAICKDIVERHQGRIWCRSRVGKGSTFIVELPMSKRAI